MTLRTVVFWLHLAAGVAVGLVVVNQAVTGMILAFEPQIVAFAERDLRSVTPPSPGAPRLSMGALLAGVQAALPEGRLSAVTVRSDPGASVLVGLGREGVVHVDPYTGRVLGRGSSVRDVLHDVEGWHRRLSTAEAPPEAEGDEERRPLGRTLTGAAAVTLFAMSLSGVYLWWPRSFTAVHLRPAVLLQRGLRGRARDFNWHNVAGVWSAVLLLVVTSTGTVMAYRWANDLLYRATGNEPPVRRPAGDRPSRRGGDPAPPAMDLDAAWKQAQVQVPDWISIGLRLPRRPGSPITASILEPGHVHPAARSQLTLDPATGAVLKWEPFAAQNAGRKLRGWMRPLHTGEAAGGLGQVLAFLAAAGALVLVGTGFAMAWRRGYRKVARNSRQAVQYASPPAT